MKIFIMILLMFVFTFGCSGTGVYMAPPLDAELCSEFDKDDSVILKMAALAEPPIPINEVYCGFVDAASIALVTEAVDKQVIADYLFDLGKWYNDQGPVSYAYVIAHMLDLDEYGEKAQIIIGILARRIRIYASDLLIGEYDDCLLRAAWAGAIRDLYLKPPKEV